MRHKLTFNGDYIEVQDGWQPGVFIKASDKYFYDETRAKYPRQITGQTTGHSGIDAFIRRFSCGTHSLAIPLLTCFPKREPIWGAGHICSRESRPKR